MILVQVRLLLFPRIKTGNDVLSKTQIQEERKAFAPVRQGWYQGEEEAGFGSQTRQGVFAIHPAAGHHAERFF